MKTTELYSMKKDILFRVLSTCGMKLPKTTSKQGLAEAVVEFVYMSCPDACTCLD